MVFTFLPNIPQGPDFLDFSWTQLLQNNQSLDGIFGKEHYAFSNLTASQGLHNTITTPRYTTAPPTPSATPPVTTTYPIAYGFQDSAPVGVIQYSRGPTNAIPTPITKLHGGPIAVAAVAVNILDFTGIPRALFSVYVADFTALNAGVQYATGMWNGTVFRFLQIGTGAGGSVLQVQATGNNLQIINNNALIPTNDVRYTIELHRLQ